VSKWLLLVYRIPREPTAARVYVWRKLKALGAVSLQDAVWVLPATPRTQEQLQWLAAEIAEQGGDANLWLADALEPPGCNGLLRQFTEPVEAEYRKILADLKKKDRDLAALSKRYQDLAARDYFSCELGQEVRERLLGASGGRKK